MKGNEVSFGTVLCSKCKKPKAIKDIVPTKSNLFLCKRCLNDAYDTLDELMLTIDKLSGESWWIAPGMDRDEHYSGDMGYVFDFWRDLKDYLES